jgi:hypothetical protein
LCTIITDHGIIWYGLNFQCMKAGAANLSSMGERQQCGMIWNPRLWNASELHWIVGCCTMRRRFGNSVKLAFSPPGILATSLLWRYCFHNKDCVSFPFLVQFVVLDVKAVWWTDQ